MRRNALLVGLLAAGGLAGCGSDTSSSGSPAPAPGPQATGFFITISNMAFVPADLRVPPGATVTVINRDATEHSVTSEATPGAFTPGASGGVAFDTGAFGAGAKTFAVPGSAAANTVVPYYCTVHTTTMIPQNGTLTIDPTATPTTAPGAGDGAGDGGGAGGGGY